MDLLKSRVVLYIFVLIFSIIPIAHAADIIIVTSDVSYQQDYVSFLQDIYGESANVMTGVYTDLDGNAPMLAQLEAADLIIIARLAISGNYDDGTEISDWNAISTPILSHSAYLTRSLRWNWMTGDREDLNNNSANLVVADAYDPVFNGLSVTNGDTVQVFTTSQNLVDVQTDPGNGTLIASPEGSSRVLIARWNDTNTNYHSGSSYTPGGVRLFFATDEFNPLGTLSEDGKTLLTNAMLSLLPATEDAASILESDGNTIVREKPLSADSFTMVLNQYPSANVDVIINPSTNINDIEIEGSAGPGQPVMLTFTPSNYNTAQQVTVWAVSDESEEGTEVSEITFQVQSTDLNINGGFIAPVQVTVFDTSVGSCPPGDLNDDCMVNFDDMLILASNWLGDAGSVANLNADDSVDFGDLVIIAQNWLEKAGPVIINEFMASNGTTILDGDGESSDWIELYNMTAYPVDMDGMYLTDDNSLLTKWRFPAGTMIDPYGYLLVFASNKEGIDYPYSDGTYLHTNFSLDANGDYLALVDTDGVTVIHQYTPQYPDQVRDISYGLYDMQNRYFITPTPLEANSSYYEGLVEDTKFSMDRGFYDSPFNVSINCATEGASIRYTTDGSEPDELSAEYTGPIMINATTCLRVAAFKAGWLPSNIDTQSYIFLEDVLGQDGTGLLPYVSWGENGPDWQMDPDVVNGNLCIDVSGQSFDVSDALLAAPTLSLVMDWNNWFGGSGNGIYISGEGVEKLCSAEFISPDGSEKGFNENCTVQIVGGSSTNRWKMDKLSMRLKFRQNMDDGTPTGGSNKLLYEFFPDSHVDEFNTIVLDAQLNMTWAYGGSVSITINGYTSVPQNPYAQYTRDQFASDIQNAMGGYGHHGRPVHLYLNGIYWGVYFAHERPDGDFAASYLGGQKEDYDVLKHGSSTSNVVGYDDPVAKLRAVNSFSDLSIAANRDLTNSGNYQAVLDLINVDDFIDYMIMNFYIGNTDWASHNWYVSRNRVDSLGGWRYHSWDAEHCMKWPGRNVVTKDDGDGSPTDLHRDLRWNADYKVLFADHIHKHFFNGGLMTPSAVMELYMNRINLVDRPIVAESARWGDNTRLLPYTHDVEWFTELERILNVYFPIRSDIVFDQMKIDGLYPNVDAPVFNINGSYQHGGYVSTDDVLTMTNPGGSGTIYYTLDGSDPRLRGGAVNPVATIFEIGSGSTQDVELLGMGSSWKYLYDGSDQGTAWQQLSYSDGSWGSGDGELGFGDGDETTDIGPKDGHMSAYFRHTFTVSDTSDMTELTVNLKYDDGAVIYINAQEVGRVNMPTGTINYDTATLPSAKENATTTIAGISPFKLTTGTNILAVEIHQKNTGSSDISFDLSLNASVSITGGDPSQEILTESTQVKARVLDGSAWSALNNASYAVGPVAENLRISEIMYHPADPNTEYIELTNIGDETINLNTVTFTRGMSYTFPSLTLAPNEYVLVVENLAEFEAEYDTTGMNIAGQYIGSLENAGEKIELKDAASQVVHLFDYKDSWYDITDGRGFSLTIKDASNADLTVWDTKSGWRPSAIAGGSPGTDDSGLIPELGSIVINEVLVHSHAEDPDWIELHNTTASEINIGGWFLSDRNNDDPNIMKFEIPLETIIPANGYIEFYENTSFGSGVANKPFALSEAGETVYLHSGSNGVITGYMEQENFDASESGVAFGRYYKASTDTYNFVAMSENTPGYANATPKVGPIVISEIMYNPPDGGTYDHDEYEYIELYNITDTDVTLQYYDALLGVDVPWKFTEGIDYTFQLGTVIQGGERLVIACNMAAFTERYGSITNVIGPYAGQLSNGGEKVDLSMPGDEEDGVRYYIRIDRVNYSDGSHPVGDDPWPVSADGAGDSLDRISDELYGNDYANWQALSPSPGW